MLDGYCFTLNFGHATGGSLHSHKVPISAVSRCSKQYIADRILRLITKSNLAGCNTGKSAGFAPLRMSWGEELH